MISSVWGNVLYYIVIYLLLVGFLVGFAITGVVTVGRTLVQTERIIDLLNYASKLLMKLNVKQENADLIVSISASLVVNLLFILVISISLST
jgi:hypothetical protein